MSLLPVFLAAALPLLGTQLRPLPPGPGRAEVEAACLSCHSADIVAQQAITEKQWTATVEKMIRWGTELADGDKPVVIAYLTKHFGPGNRSFQPVRVQPVQDRATPRHNALRDIPPFMSYNALRDVLGRALLSAPASSPHPHPPHKTAGVDDTSPITKQNEGVGSQSK